MSTIIVKKVNETYLKIDCEKSILMEIKENFSFMVPGYQFMNAYKFGSWNGRIELVHLNKKQLYVGLLERLKKFCKENKYELDIDSELADTEFSVQDAERFVKELNSKFPPKDYQFEGFIKCIRKGRGLFLSPTGSGKSFIIYMLMEYFSPLRKLLIVPTINLVNQMKTDFIDYDLDNVIGDEIQIIFGGKNKEIESNLVISTWQSIYKMPPEWFEQFDLVIGDECHGAKAQSMQSILEKCTKAKYKYGFTGTLSGMLTDQMVVEGLFGSTEVIATTKELMDSGDLSRMKIKAILLKYPEDIRKAIQRGDYQSEIAWLFANNKRNNFIKNLALSLKGNTLITVSRVDDHAIPLFEALTAKSQNPVYLVCGKVDGDEREEIRKIVDTHQNSITVATNKTFSTGVNIPNLNNIIFASPSKSRITVLQSIGRGIRKTDIKNTAMLFDIADDLAYKKWVNYTKRHYLERLQMYVEEEHNFKTYEVELK